MDSRTFLQALYYFFQDFKVQYFLQTFSKSSNKIPTRFHNFLEIQAAGQWKFENVSKSNTILKILILFPLFHIKAPKQSFKFQKNISETKYWTETESRDNFRHRKCGFLRIGLYQFIILNFNITTQMEINLGEKMCVDLRSTDD